MYRVLVALLNAISKHKLTDNFFRLGGEKDLKTFISSEKTQNFKKNLHEKEEVTPRLKRKSISCAIFLSYGGEAEVEGETRNIRRRRR